MPPEILERCRILRKDGTYVERILWKFLRNRQFAGVKFRRQHPMGIYILDFYCEEAHIAIELDGGQHAEDERIQHDAIREAYLYSQGIRTLRFWNNDIVNNLEGVLETIWNVLIQCRSEKESIHMERE